MTLYIDPPVWPGHGMLWSHLVSDVSYEELHAFAAALGCPPRAFDRDHYDVPSARYEQAVLLGAVEVGSKELLRRLTEAGLRRRRPHRAAARGAYGGALALGTRPADGHTVPTAPAVPVSPPGRRRSGR